MIGVGVTIATSGDVVTSGVGVALVWSPGLFGVIRRNKMTPIIARMIKPMARRTMRTRMLSFDRDGFSWACRIALIGSLFFALTKVTADMSDEVVGRFFAS